MGQLLTLKYQLLSVEVTLVFDWRKVCSPYWPPAFELKQTLVFDESFHQTLTMTNLSEQTVEYTGALHSYFCVGNPQKTDIPMLNDVLYDDKVNGCNEQKSALEKLYGAH